MAKHRERASQASCGVDLRNMIVHCALAPGCTRLGLTEQYKRLSIGFHKTPRHDNRNSIQETEALSY